MFLSMNREEKRTNETQAKETSERKQERPIEQRYVVSKRTAAE